MKQTILFLAFITLAFHSFAQDNEIDRLKNELNNHTSQDTFVVNRLNELATNVYLNLEEREKYANEALDRVLKVFVPGKTTTSQEVNMSNLASGTYFLQLIGNDKMDTRKVVKE